MSKAECSLPPMASKVRPKRVWCATTHPAMITAIRKSALAGIATVPNTHS
jgi:hypothetical protein